MRCLLVSPHFRATGTVRLFPPVALLYLAANLKRYGHEPFILDLGTRFNGSEQNERAFVEMVLQRIRDVDPEIVGFTCSFSAAFPFIEECSNSIKHSFPKLKIVIGGLHPSLFAREILQNCPAIDYVAIGEADESLVGLCDVLGKKDTRSIVPGMGQRGPDSGIVIGDRLEFIKDLDKLPMPAWEDISVGDYRFDYSSWNNPKKQHIELVAPILTSRSCPYDCNFCSFHSVMGRGFRSHSPDRVVDEIEFIHKQFGVNYFEFIDDNMSIQRGRLIRICREILRRKLDIQFSSISGFHISSLDREVVDALCAAGYVHAILPVEHASDFIRNEIIGKKVSREKIFEVADLFKRKRVTTRGFFIIGFPEETEETLKETVHMIRELGLDFVNVFNLVPFPGTRVFQQCLENGLLVEDVDTRSLWRGTFNLDPTKDKSFYIKPFSLEVEDLQRYRQEIDDLILKQNPGKGKNDQ